MKLLQDKEEEIIMKFPTAASKQLGIPFWLFLICFFSIFLVGFLHMWITTWWIIALICLPIYYKVVGILFINTTYVKFCPKEIKIWSAPLPFIHKMETWQKDQIVNLSLLPITTPSKNEEESNSIDSTKEYSLVIETINEPEIDLSSGIYLPLVEAEKLQEKLLAILKINPTEKLQIPFVPEIEVTENQSNFVLIEDNPKELLILFPPLFSGLLEKGARSSFIARIENFILKLFYNVNWIQQRIGSSLHNNLFLNKKYFMIVPSEIVYWETTSSDSTPIFKKYWKTTNIKNILILLEEGNEDSEEEEKRPKSYVIAIEYYSDHKTTFSTDTLMDNYPSGFELETALELQQKMLNILQLSVPQPEEYDLKKEITIKPPKEES